MTKKHYEAIAGAIRYCRDMNYPADKSGYGHVTAKLIALDLADYFSSDNPKFDRTRFLQACGIEQRGQCNQTPCWCGKCN